MGEWINAAEAAQRLGVKQATLYAYVSRGPSPERIHQADPRARLLLDLSRKAAPRSARYAVADAVLAETRRRALPEPDIDFALATLTSVAGMIPGAGEAIFAVARTAGWIAHAMEEYGRGAPLRLRAVYTCPGPVSSTGPTAPTSLPVPAPRSAPQPSAASRE